MQWFNNMKIRGKMGIGFLVMILFMGIICLTGYSSVRKIDIDLEEIFKVRLPSIDYPIQADRDLHQLLAAERSMVFTDIRSDRVKSLMATYEENMKQAEDRWEKYKAPPATDQEIFHFSTPPFICPETAEDSQLISLKIRSRPSEGAGHHADLVAGGDGQPPGQFTYDA